MPRQVHRAIVFIPSHLVGDGELVKQLANRQTPELLAAQTGTPCAIKEWSPLPSRGAA